MKALPAAPMALAMPSSRRWLEALAAWFRESSRQAASRPLFDVCTTDALVSASTRRAQYFRGDR